MLLITPDCYEAMIQHLQSVYPEEGCGLLAGSGGRAHTYYPITNTHHSPTSYLMDAQEQINAMLDIERQGWQLLAICHSHPHSIPFPSETDVAAAAYPDAVHLIVSFADEKPAVKGFFIEKNQVIPVPFSIC